MKSDKPAIIVGSHIDLPAGGIFDGTLGILSALECIRIINILIMPLKLLQPVKRKDVLAEC